MLFHLIHGGRVYQSNPELTGMASLANQLVLGDPLSLPSKTKRAGGFSHLLCMYADFGDLSSTLHAGVAST